MVLVFSVLAASLAKMAFFSSEQQTAVSPGGAVTDPVVMVETATIVKDLSLQGKVARDVDVTLRATSTGSLTAVHVGDGGVVDAGHPEDRAPLHAPPAREDVLERPAEGVADVELAGDVRRRDDEGVGARVLGRDLGTELARLLLEPVPLHLEGLRVESLVELGAGHG